MQKVINSMALEEHEYLSELTDAFIVALNAMAKRYVAPSTDEEVRLDLGGEVTDSARLAMVTAVSYLRKVILMYEEERELVRDREIMKAIFAGVLKDELAVGDIRDRYNYYNAK